MDEPVFKIRHVSEKATGRRWRVGYFFCPGCKNLHCVNIGPGVPPARLTWAFDENYVAPTVTPSVDVWWDERVRVDDRTRTVRKHCHFDLVGGVLKYQADTNAHELAGKEVSLPPLPEWFVNS